MRKRTRNSFDITGAFGNDFEDFSQIEDLDSLFDEPMDWQGGETLMYETEDSPKVKTTKRIKIQGSTWSRPSVTLPQQTIQQQQQQLSAQKNMSCEGGIGKQVCRPIIPSPLFYEVPKNDKSVSSGMATLDIKSTNRGAAKRKQKERKNFKERKRRVATAEKFSELSRLTKEIMAGNYDPECFDTKGAPSKSGRSNKLAILTDAVRVMKQLQKENHALKRETQNLKMRVSAMEGGGLNLKLSPHLSPHLSPQFIPSSSPGKFSDMQLDFTQ